VGSLLSSWLSFTPTGSRVAGTKAMIYEFVAIDSEDFAMRARNVQIYRRRTKGAAGRRREPR
jgi:hypothetical protein